MKIRKFYFGPGRIAPAYGWDGIENLIDEELLDRFGMGIKVDQGDPKPSKEKDDGVQKR